MGDTKTCNLVKSWVKTDVRDRDQDVATLGLVRSVAYAGASAGNLKSG